MGSGGMSRRVGWVALLALASVVLPTAQASPYNTTLAVSLAKACAIVFCPAQDAREWKCKECLATGFEFQDSVLGDSLYDHVKRNLHRIKDFAKAVGEKIAKEFGEGWTKAKQLFRLPGAGSSRFRALRRDSRLRGGGGGGGGKGQDQADKSKKPVQQQADVEENGPPSIKDLRIRQLRGKDDLRVALLSNPNPLSIVVVFKGTENLSISQWLMNFMMTQTDVPEICRKCEVHTGFWKLHLSNREEVLAKLKVIYDKLAKQAPSGATVPIIITGHSLGGPLAALFALYLTQNGYKDVTVYTFGSPRIGNAAFATAYDQALKDSYRVVHGMDTATQVPAKALDYHHEGVLVYCPDDGIDCKLQPGVENPPVTGTDPTKHAKYMGLSWLSFISLFDRSGCHPLSVGMKHITDAVRDFSAETRAAINDRPPVAGEEPDDGGAAATPSTTTPKPASGAASTITSTTTPKPASGKK